MWLYQHHTLGDLIDLDPVAMTWRRVEDHEKPPGARVLDDLPVMGSYAVEDGRHYFSYWTDDQTFVFADDAGFVLPICRKDRGGATHMLVPGLQVRIEEPAPGEPGFGPGRRKLTLQDGEGNFLYALGYDAERYERFWVADTTAAASEQTLADWDFFVALQQAVGIFAERAASQKRVMTLDQHGQSTVADGAGQDQLLIAQTGQPCPRAGVWACTDDLDATAVLAQGDPLPPNRGRDAQWVWSRVA